jgi:iron complex transport system ATP-binding protein
VLTPDLILDVFGVHVDVEREGEDACHIRYRAPTMIYPVRTT